MAGASDFFVAALPTVENLGYSLPLLGGGQIQNLMRQPTRADPRRQFQIPRKLILDGSRFCD